MAFKRKRSYGSTRARRPKRMRRVFKNYKRRRFNISRGRARTPRISVKRTVHLGLFSPNTTSTNGFWQYRTVSLDDGFINESGISMAGLINVVEYENIFDQFKLNAAKITLRPRVTNLSAEQDAPTAGTVFREIPYVTISLDPYDTIVPSGTYSRATYNAFLEAGKNIRTRRADRPFSVYLKPVVREQYGGGATRYMKPRFTDLNASGKAMAHRGYHMFFHNQNFSGTFTQYDVFVTYFLQFKGQK